MRGDREKIIDNQVKELYNRLDDIIRELGIRWSDLARLIGMSPKTLSSMKSLNVNPSWTSVRKIAQALDVSLDELIYEKGKTPRLYELYWAIPRYIKNIELQDTVCNHCLAIAYIAENEDMKFFEHRIDTRRNEVKTKIKELKNIDNKLN